MIRETRTQYVYLEVPKDLLDIEWCGQVGSGSINIIMSRIKWQSETMIRIVNESNIDCIFEIVDTNPEANSTKTRYLKLISAVKIDNQHLNMDKIDAPHLIDQPTRLAPRDVLERLIRLNQNYKLATQHALNLGREKMPNFDIRNCINRIDYL